MNPFWQGFIVGLPSGVILSIIIYKICKYIFEQGSEYGWKMRDGEIKEKKL